MTGESVDLLYGEFGEPDLMAKTVASMWSEWSTAMQVRKQIVQTVVEYLFATSTETTQNDANNFNHTTHRPKLTEIWDNLKANYAQTLMPNDNWFRFEGSDETSVKKEVKRDSEAYLRTKHRQNGLKGVVRELIDDWLYGDCFPQVVWVNQSHEMPDGEIAEGYTGPQVLRINPWDIAFNPMARSFARTPKIVRSLKTLGEAARDIEERPDLKYQQEVWNKIVAERHIARGMKTEEIDKFRQFELDGFGSYSQYIKGDYVEFLDFYGDLYDVESMTLYKNRVITVVDRTYVIRNEPVDTWDGNPLIFHASYRKRNNSLWGMGAFENLLGMQYYIDHLENAKADALDDMLVPDRVVIGDVDEEITDDKGAVTYYVATGGDVKDLVPDTTILSADLKINELERAMERFAGAPEQGIGIRSPGEKTKFEVGVLENNRGRLYEHNAARFEEDVMEKILNGELYLAKTHLEPDTIEFTDETTGAKAFKKLTRKDVTVNGKMVPLGARHYTRFAQLSQNLLQFQTQVLAGDKEVAQHFPSLKLAQVWEELLEFEPYHLVQPYGRIPEQLMAARRQQVAQTKLQEEANVPVTEGADIGEENSTVAGQSAQ